MQLSLLHSLSRVYDLKSSAKHPFDLKNSLSTIVICKDFPSSLIAMDPLSAIASVLSVADITIRTCERLRNLTSDLHDAPRSVQRLRQTILNIESVLRNTWLFVVEFNSSTLATEQHEVLPEVVEQSLKEIQASLNELEHLLAPDESNRDMKRRIMHVWKKKPITEIVGRLASQQNTLSLALQSVAQ